MSGLLTHKGRIREVIQHYYSPNLLIKNSLEEYENLYAFIAKIDPWEDENSPPEISDTEYYYKQLYKNIIAYKKINSSDVSAVIERVDWVEGTTYYQYSDNEYMFDLDSNGKLIKKFYVRNTYDQIFKCLYNGKSDINPNGIPSTEMPSIDFSLNSSSDIIKTADGYKWKYLYSINFGDKIKFFDDNWIPVPIKSNRSNISSISIGAGEISVINVANTGSNYINDNARNITSYITIQGDGNGAEAAAIIENGQVVDVVMTKTGNNYTYATATLTARQSFTGNGAILQTSISPIGGHGYNLLSDLGCRNVVVTSEFSKSENGNLYTNIDYRQIGLIANPVVKIGEIYEYANSFIYSAANIINVSAGESNYSLDEIVFQGQSFETATFTGKVVNFDSTNNILYVVDVNGTLQNNELIKGFNSNNIRIVLNNTIDAMKVFSGEILYVENKNKIERSPLGTEQFRLTLKY